MTNPFAIITLHAIDSYNKVMANSPSQHTLPKGLFMFSIGTAIFATLMYKVTRPASATAATASASDTTWSNFLSRFFNHYIAQQQQAQPDTDIPFEDKYFNEYDEWTAAQDAAEAAAAAADADTPAAAAHKKECLENMLYVRETINDFYGDIIMRYDAATFSFAYYARTANIPYKYLETVSRKYMIETNAPRDIHVDIRKEYAKAKEHLTNKKVSSNNTASTDTKQEPDDVFAKFKTYNTAPNISSNTNQNSTKTTTTTSEPTNNTTTKVIRENANRYSYRGKIADWDTAGPASTAGPATPATPASTASTATATASTASTATASTATPANETYAEYKKRIAGGSAPQRR
jgi:hypothetical protein